MLLKDLTECPRSWGLNQEKTFPYMQLPSHLLSRRIRATTFGKLWDFPETSTMLWIASGCTRCITIMSNPTHAEQTGIATGSITILWKQFFTCRYFVSHMDLSELEWYSWYRCYGTPLKETGRGSPVCGGLISLVFIPTIGGTL